MAVRIVIPIVGKKGRKYDIVKLVEWKAEEELEELQKTPSWKLRQR